MTEENQKIVDQLTKYFQEKYKKELTENDKRVIQLIKQYNETIREANDIAKEIREIDHNLTLNVNELDIVQFDVGYKNTLTLFEIKYSLQTISEFLTMREEMESMILQTLENLGNSN